MHEMGIAQQLVRIALDAIPPEMAHPIVKTVHLRIGKLASVVEHSLAFCFEIITRDTALASATLDIEWIPVRVVCRSCGTTREVTDPVFRCPHCEEGDVVLLSGREIEITSLELADEPGEALRP